MAKVGLAKVGFDLGELTQEQHGLLRPPATHFAGKDHQMGAAVSSRKLPVRDLLPAPRACKGCTIHPRAQWTGLAVPPHSQVTDSDVEGDPATCFPADTSRRTLQSKTPAP